MLIPGSVLARNEEFSKIAVIKFFFTVLKKKKQLSVGGGFCGENVEIYHANQQFNTFPGDFNKKNMSLNFGY